MLNEKILIVNLLCEEAFKNSFDNRIAQAFADIDSPYDTIYLNQLNHFREHSCYTRLLISGSTESAMDEKHWYPDLHRIIDYFITAQKPILGICFGHQFLVRHLLGKQHVRKSATPEVGYTEITLADNPLFKQLSEVKSGVYHYDEVFDLDERFEIIARSSRCQVQGFQIKGRPIWGLQFHPDFIYRDLFAFTQQAADKDPLFAQHHCQTAICEKEFRENDQIFKNWLAISEPAT